MKNFKDDGGNTKVWLTIIFIWLKLLSVSDPGTGLGLWIVLSFGLIVGITISVAVVVYYILLTKTTATQNEESLSYHRVAGYSFRQLFL